MAAIWFLLAEQAAWERLGERFQTRHESWETWLALAAPVVVIGLLLALGKWWLDRAARKEDGAHLLFRELAAAHHLTWYDTRLLRRLARASRLAHPAHVFLNPEVYQDRAVAERLSGIWPEILTLQKQLFTASQGDATKPRSPNKVSR
jgi:hypothetical protein